MGEKSCGAIIFKIIDGVPHYLLIESQGTWSFPKGKMELGETEIETARREVFEETGLKEIEFIPFFREVVEYSFKRGGKTIDKLVVYYLARSLEEGSEELNWFPIGDALSKLSFLNLRDLLLKAHRWVYDYIKGKRDEED